MGYVLQFGEIAQKRVHYYYHADDGHGDTVIIFTGPDGPSHPLTYTSRTDNNLPITAKKMATPPSPEFYISHMHKTLMNKLLRVLYVDHVCVHF